MRQAPSGVESSLMMVTYREVRVEGAESDPTPRTETGPNSRQHGLVFSGSGLEPEGSLTQTDHGIESIV